MNYLLVDFEDVDLAYEYYKTTGLRLDQFIVEYSLDKIIMMDSNNCNHYIDGPLNL